MLGGGTLPSPPALRRSPWRLVGCWGRGWRWWRRSVSRQHNIGCKCKPERVFAYKGNIREHRNDSEALNNERNDVHAENVEHRRRLLQFRTPFDSLGHNQDARSHSVEQRHPDFDSSLSLGQKNAAGSVQIIKYYCPNDNRRICCDVRQVLGARASFIGCVRRRAGRRRRFAPASLPPDRAIRARSATGTRFRGWDCRWTAAARGHRIS